MLVVPTTSGLNVPSVLASASSSSRRMSITRHLVLVHDRGPHRGEGDGLGEPNDILQTEATVLERRRHHEKHAHRRSLTRAVRARARNGSIQSAFAENPGLDAPADDFVRNGFSHGAPESRWAVSGTPGLRVKKSRTRAGYASLGSFFSAFSSDFFASAFASASSSASDFAFSSASSSSSASGSGVGLRVGVVGGGLDGDRLAKALLLLALLLGRYLDLGRLGGVVLVLVLVVLVFVTTTAAGAPLP